MRRLFLITFIVLAASFQLHAADRYLNIHCGSEPETIDPGLADGNVEHRVIVSLFDGLTTYNPKTMIAVPALAEHWTVSPDGKVYTFTLRKNATWSNGTPITAQDFVYAWQRVLNPKTAAKFAHHLFILKNAEGYNTGKITDPTQLGVKAKDPATLVVTLEHPAPYFLYLTSHYPYFPVPRDVVKKFGVNWTRPENIVVSGPFMLKEWVPQKGITMAKNPRYWDAAAVKAPGITFVPVEDSDTALKMFDGGQLDTVWNVPTLKTPELRKRADYRSGPLLASYYIWINTALPQFKDPRVRRALALAIDRNLLTDKFLHGIHTPISTYVPPNIPGYTPPKGLDYNPAEAKKLLAEAGVDPASMQVEILYNTQDMHKTVAEVVQQMWKQNLGINATLHNEEWKSYLKDLHQVNFVLARGAWGGDYPDATTFLDNLTSSSPQNNSNWKSPKYDALIDQAHHEPDVAKRAKLLQDAEAVILTEVPLIPLFQQNKDYIIAPALKGYYPNSLDVHPWKFVYLEGATPRSPWQQIRSHFGKGTV